jgi:hypothetical protein
MSEDDVEEDEDLEEPQLVRATAKIAHSATEKNLVFIINIVKVYNRFF